MARIYSARLALGTHTVGAAGLLYTCPVGRVAIVRDIEVMPLGAPPTFHSFFVNLAATFFSQVGPAQYVSAQWQGRVVLVAGDTIHMSVTGSSFQYIVSGYELSL